MPLVADHVAAHLGDVHPVAVAMATLCGVAAWLGGRSGRRVPAALLAVAACAVVTALARLDVPPLPDLPLPLPLPRPVAPGLPDPQVAQFVRSALALFALTTAETLLSAGADDQRVPGARSDPDQVSLSGPVTFLASPALDVTRARLAALEPASGVILDVRSVSVMDVTGCEGFVTLVDEAPARGLRRCPGGRAGLP